MSDQKFADSHNMVVFLEKPAECEGFEQTVDFMNAKPIKYALTVNPTIYTSCIEQFWATAKAKTINGELTLMGFDGVDGGFGDVAVEQKGGEERDMDGLLVCMDKAEITRKPSKMGKHGHGKRKSTKEAEKSRKTRECHVDVKKAQEKRDFTLLSLREQAQTSHQWIASLAIRSACRGRFVINNLFFEVVDPVLENLSACGTRRSNYPNSNVTIQRRRRRQVSNIVEPDIRTIVAPMAERTMEELLRAHLGQRYEKPLFLPEINADHFEIKTNLLQLVQANPFYGRENDNPHAHINSFKRITSTLRFRNVPNDVIKLMMFPYSLEGAAKTWYEKEPPNSILTWEDLVTKFVNQFFPPSKTTHLKNEISRFTQKFEETFSEAWERFKELLRACPHHGFTKLTQVDTFYNGLNDNEQDSLNAAAGGNLLSKTTREALNIIENKSKVRYSRNKPNASRMNATSSKTDERIDKLADQLSSLIQDCF
ncbi:reverse transcriptase domain-containing protein [Tanacetum coccineum]